MNYWHIPILSRIGSPAVTSQKMTETPMTSRRPKGRCSISVVQAQPVLSSTTVRIPTELLAIMKFQSLTDT